MSLASILKEASLDPEQFSGLLGVSPKVFKEWVAGQRTVSPSYVAPLSSALGVPVSEIMSPRKREGSQADIAPAIWFKLRSKELTDADRECVLLVRLLGHQMNELELVTSKRLRGWKSLFSEIRADVNFQGPPRAQGREAARIFRTMAGLDKGKRGIGEVLRGNLRSIGILVVETPIPESTMEGCSFFVGPTSEERPCLFTNTYRSIWFRRNVVLAHELGHAIFEGEPAGISLDFREEGQAQEFGEERAQAFALELLIPPEVLQHLTTSSGIDLRSLSPRALAQIVADAHVEQRALLQGLVDSSLITEEERQAYLRFDIGAHLHEISDHALTAKEYIDKRGEEARSWVGKVTTTIPSRSVRLPVTYIKAVLDAYTAREISVGRAAEFLMIDPRDFANRFEEYLIAAEQD
jgi:Zn-dependent peptidase ImmA (M78 family)